jgi:MFS family permease
MTSARLSATSAGSFFRNPAYRRWFTADTSSALGLALRGIVVALVAYQVSGSTALAGLLGTLSQVTQQVMAFFGGTVIDRHDRRMLVALNAGASATGWTAVALLLYFDRLSFAALAVIVCVVSAVNGLLGKATDAMLRSIVSTERYPQARGINEGRDATVSMVGGPLGGLLYGFAVWLPFLAMTVLYVIAGVTATRIHIGEGPASSGSAETQRSKPVKVCNTFLRDLIEGWRWTLRRHTLVALAGVACLMNFGSNGMLYAIQLHLVSNGTSSVRIGLIDTGTGIVILCGSLLASRLASRIPVGYALAATLACYAACMVPMLFTDDYMIVLAFSSLAFLPFPLFNAMAMGFIFAKTPIELQGRVSTAVSIPAQALSMFVQLIAGLLLPAIGFNGTILVFLDAILLALAAVLLTPRLRRIPGTSHWGDAEL